MPFLGLYTQRGVDKLLAEERELQEAGFRVLSEDGFEVVPYNWSEDDYLAHKAAKEYSEGLK